MSYLIRFSSLWHIILLLDVSFGISNTNNSISFNESIRNPRGKPFFLDEKELSCRDQYRTEETPWTAIILNKESGRLVCLGSIIDEKHILSASKCLQYVQPSNIKVLLGYRKAWWRARSEVITVDKVFEHQRGLMILRLMRAVGFSNRILPVKLLEPEKEDYDEKDEDDRNIPDNSEDKKLKYNLDDRMNESSIGFENDFAESSNLNKRAKLQIEPKVPNLPFDIQEFYVVGFPVVFTDIIGNAIHKHLHYVVKEDERFDDEDECSELLGEPKLSDVNDPSFKSRQFCLVGNSKLCWGCLGGPIFDRKSMKQVGVVGMAGYKMDCEKSAHLLIALRVDIYIHWIHTNSFVPLANN